MPPKPDPKLLIDTEPPPAFGELAREYVAELLRSPIEAFRYDESRDRHLLVHENGVTEIMDF